MPSDSVHGNVPESRDVFATTHWSVVLTANDSDESLAAEALEQLIQTYWRPLYGYARGRGHSKEDAEDLIQEFCAKLLSPDSLRRVDPKLGRFRAFLLASLKHFLANDWDRKTAQKRGGGRQILSLETVRAEAWLDAEPADSVSPDILFERRWTRTLLNNVQEELRKEYVEKGQDQLFECLRPTLAGYRQVDSAAAGRGLGLSESAVRVAAHRLRNRYRELLRREIANTVASPAEVEDEIKYLFSVFS